MHTILKCNTKNYCIILILCCFFSLLFINDYAYAQTPTSQTNGDNQGSGDSNNTSGAGDENDIGADNTITSTPGGEYSPPSCAQVGDNPLGVAAIVLCCILGVLTGTVGSALATFAIVFTGFAGVTGKLPWQKVFIVAFAVFAIFAAANITEAIAEISGNPYIACPE